jgi:hypothetical protein
MMTRCLLILTSFLLIPEIALADGGGPLLLIINGMAFHYGGILIIATEWFIYFQWAKIPKYEAFWDALLVNLISTLLVGFGVPLLIALISVGVGAILPNTINSYALALGTWVWEGLPFPKVMWASTIFWWIITFILTVIVERKTLERRWISRNYKPVISARNLSWRSNGLTYFGLLIVIVGSIIWENYG